jgi:hypothetical protein
MAGTKKEAVVTFFKPLSWYLYVRARGKTWNNARKTVALLRIEPGICRT